MLLHVLPLLSYATGFDGTVKVWKMDPSLDELMTEVVHTASYFPKEAPGGGEERWGSNTSERSGGTQRYVLSTDHAL